jgi:hypothetical protein
MLYIWYTEKFRCVANLLLCANVTKQNNFKFNINSFLNYLFMRKVKFFLTMLAVAGVLFATSSCVDDTESESVANLRNAKAAELLANEQALKDWAAADKIRAEGEAALNKAKAETEAAIALYHISLGKAAETEANAKELKAKANLLFAQADTIKAAGEKALALAQAEQFLARAENIRQKALAKAKEDEEALKVTIAQNNVTIALHEDSLAQVTLQAQISLLEKQALALKAAANLEVAAAEEYAELNGYLYDELAKIVTQQGLIDGYKIAIKETELALATYTIDSERFIQKFIAESEADIAKDNLALQYAQRDLELWESSDVGLESLKAEKDKLIRDTLTAKEALEVAKAKVAELEADTVTASEAKAAAKVVYDDAIADADVVNEAYLTALNNYDLFLSVTAGGYSYISTDLVANSGWLYTGPGYAPKYWDYEGVRYNAPSNPYDYGDMTWVIVYEDDNRRVQCYIDLDYPVLGAVDYWFDVYDKTTVFVPYTFEQLYSSVEDYKHHVEILKSNSAAEIADAQKNYDDLQKKLNDSIASLKLLGAKERTLYKELQDSIAFLAQAEKTLVAALEVYNAAKDKYNANPTEANLAALDIARTAYEGLKADGTVVATANGGALGAYYRATTYRDNASNKHNVANDQYYLTNNEVKNLVANVVYAKNLLDNAKSQTAALEAAENTLETLEKLPYTTREKLLFAKQDAEKAKNDLLTSDGYTDAVSAYNKAGYAYTDALYAYANYISTDLNLAQSAYDLAILEYATVEFIQFQIDLGGDLTLQNKKANKIAESKAEIARLEADIASIEAKLLNVTEYAEDDDENKLVATVIAGYQKTIAEKQNSIDASEKEIDEAKKKAEYYEAAIEAFLKKLGE